MTKEQKLIGLMIAYETGNAGRIQHFIKVYTFSIMIGEAEKLCENTMEILRAASLVHDIGIKAAIEKYGSAVGNYQEELGPALAEAMLKEAGYDEEVIERVSYLVGHHHTYTNIEGLDYQILVEADFLVNLYENNSDEKAIRNTLEKIFITDTGKGILIEMFNQVQ